MARTKEEIAREKEIRKEAGVRIPIHMIPFKDYFVKGAQWADDHPRKGLVDIDKVCDFLNRKGHRYLIPSLCNAMER